MVNEFIGSKISFIGGILTIIAVTLPVAILNGTIEIFPSVRYLETNVDVSIYYWMFGVYIIHAVGTPIILVWFIIDILGCICSIIIVVSGILIIVTSSKIKSGAKDKQSAWKLLLIWVFILIITIIVWIMIHYVGSTLLKIIYSWPNNFSMTFFIGFYVLLIGAGLSIIGTILVIMS